MTGGEIAGGVFGLFILSFMIVHFGDFFHRSNQNMTTVFLFMGGIIGFVVIVGLIGAVLGFMG